MKVSKVLRYTLSEYLPDLIQNINLLLFINHYHCLKKKSLEITFEQMQTETKGVLSVGKVLALQAQEI